jgi:hypothetical protein
MLNFPLVIITDSVAGHPKICFKYWKSKFQDDDERNEFGEANERA